MIFYEFTTVRIERVQYEEIRALAREEGISIIEKIRTYIEWGLEIEEKEKKEKRAVQPN